MKGTDGPHRNQTRDETAGRHGPSSDGRQQPSAGRKPLPFPYAESASSPPHTLQLTELDMKCAALIVAHYSITREAFEAGETHAFNEVTLLLESWLSKQLHSFTRALDLEDVRQEVLMNVFNQACAVREANEKLRTGRDTHHAHPMPLAAAASEAGSASGASKKPHGQFDPDRGVPFTGWLRRLLTYKAITMLRKNRRFDLDEALRRSDECHSDAEVHILVEELLAGLNELEASVTRARFDGKEFRVIAEELGVNFNVVYRAFCSAMRKMRKLATGT